MVIGLAALALAVPAALFVLWPLRRQHAGRTSTPADDERAALEAEKGLALRALRDLTFDHQAGHMLDDDYTELRARYEARASAVLKRLDELGPPLSRASSRVAPVGEAAPASGSWTRRPVVLSAAGAGLLGFGVILGILVTRFTGPAPPGSPESADATPRAGIPRGVERGSADGPPRSIPPAMLAGMLQAAHASLDAGRYQEAIAAYTAVLKREPQNVDAITHLGVILALASHADGAIEAFDRALSIDPDYTHALWDKARVLYELKRDYAGAIGAWERFVRVSPAGADRDQAVARIREARTRLGPSPAGSRP